MDLTKDAEDTVEHVGKYDHIHVGQKYDWDCGVACLEMAVKWWNADLDKENKKIIDCIDISTALWTIDIFVGLHQNGIFSTIMYTNYKGVNPSHFDEIWYKDHLSADIQRVNDKFLYADELSLDIRVEALSMRAICQHLSLGPSESESGSGSGSGSGVAIILVDINKMRNYPSVESAKSEKYTGHYIFLLGYDSRTSEAQYLDPSKDPGVEYISIDILEEARMQNGTDQDIIVISKQPRTEWSRP